MFKILVRIVLNSGKEDWFYDKSFDSKPKAISYSNEIATGFSDLKSEFLRMLDTQDELRIFRLKDISMFSVKVVEQEEY